MTQQIVPRKPNENVPEAQPSPQDEEVRDLDSLLTTFNTP